MATNRKPIQITPPKATPVQSFSFPNGYAGGMNTQAKPDQIAPNETPDAMNMELRNGVWSKRYGFDVFTKVPGSKPIRGMTCFKAPDQEPVMLVVSNGKIFEEELHNV